MTSRKRTARTKDNSDSEADASKFVGRSSHSERRASHKTAAKRALVYEESDEEQEEDEEYQGCANPLFLRWVQEFNDEKDYRKRGGPPRATGYEGAITGIAACTTRYDHPADLKKVRGVGPTTIARLTERLEEYCAECGIPVPDPLPKPTRGRKAPVKATVKGKAGRPAAAAGRDSSDDQASAPRRRALQKRKAPEMDEDNDDDEVEEEEKPVSVPKKRTRTRK